MRWTNIALASATLLASVLAIPAPDATRPGHMRGPWGKHKQTARCSPPSYDSGPGSTFCITNEQAAAGADIFKRLIQQYSDELALEALTEDFVDWSSAVNIIRNQGNEGPIPVDGISFDGRAAFMTAQGAQPHIPFETLNTWHNCDTITTRWKTPRSAKGQPTEANDIPVVGLTLLTLVPDSENSYGFRIKELYSEFNSAAWLVNLGVFTPTPVAASKRTATPIVSARN